MSQSPRLSPPKNLGELIITGVAGKSLSETSAQFLRKKKIGGVGYFGHNYQSPDQLLEFTRQIQACRDESPLWISVDQEGGRVQRFKAPFTLIPKASEIGKSGSPTLAFEIASVVAKELSAVGINLNFSPVADIMTNPKNPVIGDRSYGTDEDSVSKFASAVIRGHLQNGVLPCLKHFPGHGDTHVDSHFALPSVETSTAMLQSREFLPFQKGMRAKCPMIMTAHVLNPNLDSEFPATFSKKTLTDVLRGELGFRGIIISDDMIMQAVTDRFGIADAPVLAINAGCDMVFYRTEENARAALDALEEAYATGKLDPKRVDESIARLTQTKAEYLADYEVPERVSSVIGSANHQAVVDKIPHPKN